MRDQQFFAVPVQFGSDEIALAFSDPTLDEVDATPEGDAEIPSERPSQRPHSPLPRDSSLIALAREHLSVQLDKGDFDLGSMASSLGTSERTLRRRLRELGTGYRELIDEVRRERALTLAHEGAYNVTTIATQVGFADVTTFTRAFRRWTGTLPSSYMLEARSRAHAERQPAQ